MGMQAPQLSQTMMQMQREMAKAGVIDEMMEDAMDSAMDTDDMEEETEAEVDKVPCLASNAHQCKLCCACQALCSVCCICLQSAIASTACSKWQRELAFSSTGQAHGSLLCGYHPCQNASLAIPEISDWTSWHLSSTFSCLHHSVTSFCRAVTDTAMKKLSFPQVSCIKLQLALCKFAS